jgi:putative hydrolase of the HAD superfamily
VTIRAITLDLDDTLWPVWPAIRGAEQALHTWLSEHAPPVAHHCPPERMREFRPQAAEQAQARGLAHDLAWIRQHQIGMAFAAADHPTDQTVIARAYEVFETARQAVEPFPEVAAVLTTLASRCPLVALTNGSADIERMALGRHFKGAFSAMRLGIAKPDPGIFHAACEHLGLPPGEVLHVGDDPRLDVVAARAAGLQTLWINRDGRDWPLEEPSGQAAADLRILLDLVS